MSQQGKRALQSLADNDTIRPPRRSPRRASANIVDELSPQGSLLYPPSSAEPSSPDVYNRDVGWRYLPLDLVRLIVSFIPFRPRLLVVAHVCKRWSLAVHDSITELPPCFSPSLTSRALERWPKITHLRICASAASFNSNKIHLSAIFGARFITSLDLRKLAPSPHSCTDPSSPCVALSSLTNLTRLSLLLTNCCGLTTLVTQNSPTLQSLSVECSHQSLDLQHLRLPKLTSLSWTYLFNDPHYESFARAFVSMLIAHSSSLSSLSLYSIPGFASEVYSLAISGLPVLRSLTLRAICVPMPSLSLLIRSAPQLVDLHLWEVIPLRAFLSHISLLSPVLRSLKLPDVETANVKQLLPALQQCTRLGRLLPSNNIIIDLHKSTFRLVLRVHMAVAHQITRIDLRAGFLPRDQWTALEFVNLLSGLTRLDALLPVLFPAKTVASWRLPCLHTLQLCCTAHALENSLEICKSFLIAAPWLRVLQVKCAASWNQVSVRHAMTTLEELIIQATPAQTHIVFDNMTAADECHRMCYAAFHKRYPWVVVDFCAS